MNTLKIIAATVLAFVIYGILHDQVTARVCIEYFTVGHLHPAFLPVDNPTVIALYWGIVATWWFGLPIGVLLAMASNLGKWPAFTVRDLLRPALVVMLLTGVSALVAGMMGYFAAQAGWVWLIGYADVLPASKEAPFIADLWAHTASYNVGGLLSLGLCGWVIWRRRSANTLYNE